MTNKTDDPLQAALDKAPALVALVSVSILVISLSHEYGYFWIVGRQFQTFLSTTDYLSNAVSWFPLGLLFIYGNIEWWRFKENEKAKKDWNKWKNWIWPTLVALFFAAILITTEWPPRTFTLALLMSGTIFVWAKIWRRVFPLQTIREPFGTIIALALRAVVPVVLAMITWGMVSAETDLGSYSDPYIVSFKSTPTINELRLPLRTFDKGLLLRNPATARVEFVKWDDISQVSKPIYEPARSQLCYWFAICPMRYKTLVP